MSAPATTFTVGIALDGRTATAVWRQRPDDAWQDATIACDATPAGIEYAFAALAREAPAVEHVRVTLVRPLANARPVEFPRMSRSTLERVLERDWARYVIGTSPSMHTVSARQTRSGQWRAVFAPTETLDAIVTAAANHGWNEVSAQVSDDALASAAVVIASGDATPQFVIVCDGCAATDVVYLRGGEPSCGRRFPRAATDEDVFAFIRATAGAHAKGLSIALIGPPARTGALALTIRQSGHRASVLDVGLTADATSLATIAAMGTLGTPQVELRSPAARAVQARRLRAVARWLLATAAVALLAAFGIERIAVNTELTSVRTQRADLSGQVRSAMAIRRDAENAAELASMLGQREASASRATAVIAAVANALPAGTALTTLGIAGDSVTVEGESARSAAVYNALRAVPQLRQLRLTAPLRQDRQLGADAVERFAFRAVTMPSGSPRGATP